MPADPPVVGIDLGATNMQFGVVDGANRIVGRSRGKTEASGGISTVLANMDRGVRGACAAAGIPLADIAGIGVAAAGAIDVSQGVVLDAPNLCWSNVPLADMLKSTFRRPIALDNDVNGAVWAEHNLGAGRGRGDMLGVWVGTGVGGGLVLGGRLYHGGFFTAGEIGLTVIRPDGGPGERTLEDLCSRTGMLKRMADRLPDRPPPADTAGLASACAAGEEPAVSVVNEAADLLGVAIANWVTGLSLKTVVIGGGVTEVLGTPYLKRIHRSFTANVFPDRCRGCALKMTQLAADSGLLGAALLAREMAASR